MCAVLSGGIDDGEEPHVAALREVTEETSIKSARIVGELDRWLHYDFPTKASRAAVAACTWQLSSASCCAAYS